jgi:tRNA pseudouridine55 synthase
VRTLAADLGRALGVPAHLEALRRTEAGPFAIEGAISLAEAEALVASGGPEALRARLVPPAEALAFLPAARLDEAGVRDLGHGKAVALASPEGLVRALDAAGRLVAVCRSDGRLLRPVRVLGTGEASARPRRPAVNRGPRER